MHGAQRAHLALAWQAPADGAGQHACFNFASLPHAVALHVLSFVPADARARAALVCRAWRALTGERSLWTTLDLSTKSGVRHPVSDALLRGAAALAGGHLTALNLDNCNQLTQDARLEVVMANAGSLRELRCIVLVALPFATVEALVRAAPQLQTFDVTVKASVVEATRMLSNDGPFGPVRVIRLRAVYRIEDDGPPAAAIHAFAAAVSRHVPLYSVLLRDFPLDAAPLLDAVLAAMRARRLHELQLQTCRLSPASVPAIAPYSHTGISSFAVVREGQQLLNEIAAAQLAFTANRALYRVFLSCVDFWRDAAAAASVLRALTGHPSLCDLVLFRNDPLDQAAAGAALAALVAANTPALRCLRVQNSSLGDVGMRLLLDALEHNTHLRDFGCLNTGMSEAFAREHFLPAIRANTSLRKLNASESWGGGAHGQAPPEVLEAEALVAARSDGS